MQSLTIITFIMSEKIPVSKFRQAQTFVWPKTCQTCLSCIHTRVTLIRHIVHDIVNVCSNYTTFKLQRTRIQHTQFAVYNSDTPVNMQQVKVIKPRMTKQTPSKVVIIQLLEDFASMVSKKEPTIVKKVIYFMVYFLRINNPVKLQLNQIRTQKFQFKLFDTAVTLKMKCNQGH